MKPPRLTQFVLLIGTIVVGIITTGVIAPLLRSMYSRYEIITSQKEQVAELQAQQRNIAEVTKEFDALKKKEIAVDEQFLSEDASVDFFNTIDELISNSGATSSQLRIDTPVRTKEFQMLGIHLTFNASYRSTVAFIRGVMSMKQSVSISNIALSGSTDQSKNSVIIDAQVPWSQIL